MEVELRAKIKNTSLLKNKLKSIGAKLVSKKVQKDSYYGFYQTSKMPFIFRIRKTKNKSIFTFKGKKYEGDTAWPEFEFIIDGNEKQIHTALIKSDFNKFLEINKKREKYSFNDFEINIDKIENLGEFIEIEILSENEKEGKSKVMEVMNKLGFEDSDIIHKGYVSLMKMRNNEFLS